MSRTYDDLVDAGAGQHRQAALVEVHQRQVRPTRAHVLVAVQAHQQEIALRLRQLRQQRGSVSAEQSKPVAPDSRSHQA